MNITDLQRSYKNLIPPRDFDLLVQKALNFSSSDYLLQKDAALSKQEEKSLLDALKRRESGEPVQRIFGEWEFWGLPFYLTEETLVPRPDTETLVEAALKRFKNNPPKNIIDLGTGSGCILISLLHEWTEAFGIGIDFSQDAIKTAKRNALRNNVFERAEFAQTNWLQGIDGKFDLILSNPPYIDTSDLDSLMPEVRNFDPILALDGGKDGTQAIHMILESLPKALKKDGVAFFEIGFNQCDKVVKIIENHHMKIENVHRDLGGHERVIEFVHGDKS